MRVLAGIGLAKSSVAVEPTVETVPFNEPADVLAANELDVMEAELIASLKVAVILLPREAEDSPLNGEVVETVGASLPGGGVWMGDWPLPPHPAPMRTQAARIAAAPLVVP
jgi:hypothetical protein